MKAYLPSASRSGHTLIELVVVLALASICLVVGMVSLGPGLRNGEARGAAQGWQSTTAWAQVGVLWHAGSVEAAYQDGHLTAAGELGLCGGALSVDAPRALTTSNVSRWVTGTRVAVGFSGSLASPDGGGSIYFDGERVRYRVVVRPESGLTARNLSLLPQ